MNGIGNGVLETTGIITVPVRFDDVCIEMDVCVVKDDLFNYDFLVGRNAIQRPDIEVITDFNGSKLVNKKISDSILNVNSMIQDDSNMIMELTSKLSNLDKNLQDQVTSIFQKHLSVLSNIGSVKTGELKLNLKENKCIYYRPYRLSPHEREKVKEIVQSLLDNGVIRESDSPFASPVILVKKKDGNDRLCIDYRSLNKIIEKDRYPLPLIEDQIDKLGKAKYYISIDMKNGFHQIPVSPDSVKYTAFITPDGHYEFLKMPFGICNGPSVFQRAITKAVCHLQFLLVYIDDILIPFTTIEEGLDYLEQTISALSSAGFTINLKKCKFFVTTIEYLGRQISNEGVRPSESKVSALVNSPIPKNIKQVRQFMGLASYFRKFIPNFATRTACITMLTKKGQRWNWGVEQDIARKYVIDHLTSTPPLSIFDPEQYTELHTDASSLGYGGILIQKIEGQTKIVGYYSKRTSPAESKYSSYDLETLAIFNAMKHFRVYLLGIQFKLVTDCNAIKATMNKRDLSPRVARWWTYLQDFQFEIIYRKGKYISHVDFFSRNPVDIPTVQCTVNASNDPQSWLEVAQYNDSETQTLIDKIRTGELDENQYIVQNNLLYYKIHPDSSPKLYIPKGTRLNILRLFHDQNCHVGYEKTINKIREHFWFPGMAAFVKKYLMHCLVCVQRKGHHGPKQGFLHPIKKTAIPFHTIHLDCTGPFTRSNEGYKHILLIIDGFTKFCILKPLKTLTSDELVPIIRETVTLFGTPSLVITDRGTNFSSTQIQSLFQELNIEHHLIATGIPRGNGQVERYVSTVTNLLNTACNNDSSDWPNELWRVQQSINTTTQKSTGFSPLRLLIGIDANIPPIQALLDDVLDGNPPVPPINIQADRELAYERLIQVAEKFKKRFDSTRRNNVVFAVGDLVYVSQEHRRNDKLQPKFKGPYEISSLLPNDRYALRGLRGLRNIVIPKEKLRYWPGEFIDDNEIVEDALT